MGVTVIDTTLEPLTVLRVMIEGLALNAETGLWLTPLNEIPKVPRLSPFDLIYLDGDCRVIQGAELLPGVDFPGFEDKAASALVLPLKSMSSSKTCPGDQLVMEVAEETEGEAETAPASSADNSAGQGAQLAGAGFSSENGDALSRFDDVFKAQLTTIEWLDEEEEEEEERVETAEPTAEAKEQEKAPFMSADEETESQPEQTSVSSDAPPVEPNAQPPYEQPEEDSEAAPSGSDSVLKPPRSRKKRLREKRKAAAREKAEELLKAAPLSIEEVKVSEPAPLPVPAAALPVTQNAKPKAEPPVEDRGVATAPAVDAVKTQHAAIERFIEKAKAEPPVREKDSVITRALQWLYPDMVLPTNRRKSVRRPSPELVAYYWNDGVPQVHEIGDISSTGVYLVTQERWLPGQLISLTLQRKGPPEDRSEYKVLVEAGAVRWGENGVGLSFLLPPDMDLLLWEGPLKRRVGETEPEYVLREFRMARAIAFVRRISPSVAEEVERLLQKELSNYRVASAVDIALKAEALLAYDPDADKMRARPDLALRIIQFGSWADADFVRQFWGGLLAASCTVEGGDESSSTFVDLLSVLTLIHVRILAAACARATKVTSENGVTSSYPLYCTADEMCKIAGTNDLTKIHRAIGLLADLGLLEKSAQSSFVSYSEKSKSTPTSLGLEMYARCNGHRGAPK